MPEPKRCQSCGGSTGPSAKFCESCGAEQLEQATESSSIPAVRYCQACGARSESGERFCGECGQSLAETAAPLARTPTPQPSPALPPMISEQPAQSWYTQTWAAVVALILFFPLGLFLMWRYQRWPGWVKTVITVPGSLFTILVIVSAAVGGEDGDAEAVRQAASPSPTVEAPAAAPQPTPSPESTPTPEPSMPAITAAECQYLNELGEQLVDGGSALFAIGELTGEFNLSDEWKLDMALQFALIWLTREDALASNPPASLSGLHTTWLSILDTLVEATDLMGEGIDEFDANKVDASAELILEADAQLMELNSTIAEFSASRSESCS